VGIDRLTNRIQIDAHRDAVLNHADAHPRGRVDECDPAGLDDPEDRSDRLQASHSWGAAGWENGKNIIAADRPEG